MANGASPVYPPALSLDFWHPNAADHRLAAAAIPEQVGCKGLLALPFASVCSP
jgi:hypothetical protein